MKESKLGTLVLTTFLVAGCGINPQPQNTYHKSLNQSVGEVSDLKIKLSKEEIVKLDKEYSFKTKALSAAYFLRQLTQLIGGDNGIANGSKIIRNLEYARIKGETGVPFHALCAANPTFYTTLTGVASVITQRSLSGPFDIFMGNADPYGNVTTLAGGGIAGYADSNGSNAMFNAPSGVALDSSGNVYVADVGNHIIRKITPTGDVTTFAGSGNLGFADGNGTNAQFKYPFGVAVDSSGNVYVADSDNNRIRQISPAGDVTTFAGSGNLGFADGNGTNAQFKYPFGVAVDSSGNVYVADSGNNRIRQISPAGDVTTFAGSGIAGHADGNGTNAQFYGSYGLAVDSSGNVYVAEDGNHIIRKITPTGDVTTFAGRVGTPGYADGNGTNAQFSSPEGIAVDSSGNVFVADYANQKIRKITSVGDVTNFAGSGAIGSSDGKGTDAQFYYPYGIAVDSSGNIFVGDFNNNSIRKIQYP